VLTRYEFISDLGLRCLHRSAGGAVSVTPNFSGEVQFRRYSDTSTQGQQIVFAVADREALEAFIGKEGKRFMAVLVEIGDDEQPVPPPPRKDTRGPLCREACDYCAMPEFWRWCEEMHGTCKNEADAKSFILDICDISSRKELDANPEAGAYFREGIRIPFMHYMREKGKA
jgi:hypothetical protein